MAAVPAKEPMPRKNVASRARIRAGKERSTWMQKRTAFLAGPGPGREAAQAMAAGMDSTAPRNVPVMDIWIVAHSRGRTFPRNPQSGGNIFAAMSVRWSRRLHIRDRSHPVNQAAPRNSSTKAAAARQRIRLCFIRPPPRRKYPAGRPPSHPRGRRQRQRVPGSCRRYGWRTPGTGPDCGCSSGC